MRPVGVHTSIKESLINSIKEATLLGCDTFQIFLHSPRTWNISIPDEDTVEGFKRLRKLNKLYPFVVHASYLINLISPNPKVVESSKALLKKELNIADVLEADYYVIHLKDNSMLNKKEILSRLKQSFSGLSKLSNCKILIENTAKSKITARINDLIETLMAIDNENVSGLCIDTCHLFAAGYDISKDEGIDLFVKEFQKNSNFVLVKLIHLNDSKAPAGSEIDRHEHIGKGKIGIEGFKKFFKISELSSTPLILETPKKTPLDDPMNLATVRKLLSIS